MMYIRRFLIYINYDVYKIVWYKDNKISCKISVDDWTLYIVHNNCQQCEYYRNCWEPYDHHMMVQTCDETLLCIIKLYTAFSLIKDTQFSLIKVVLCPPITAALKYKIILTMKTCRYKELVPSWILLAQWQKKSL